MTAKKPANQHLTSPPNQRPNFWQTYPLSQLTPAEWEALCDGCGMCCLIKFEDEITGEVEYSDVGCQLLDCQTGRCSNYANRHQFVPDCISLSVEQLAVMPWLPASCAYKCLYLGKPLPDWHYLLTGNRQQMYTTMQKAGIGVMGRCVNENHVPDEIIETRIIRWVKQ